MDIRWIAAAATLSLAACASMDAPAKPMPMPSGEPSCAADEVQSFVGQAATPEVGARLLKQSGARTLRWVPPRTAVTMDFRPDRLTVSYDDAYKIGQVSCG